MISLTEVLLKDLKNKSKIAGGGLLRFLIPQVVVRTENIRMRRPFSISSGIVGGLG